MICCNGWKIYLEGLQSDKLNGPCFSFCKLTLKMLNVRNFIKKKGAQARPSYHLISLNHTHMSLSVLRWWILHWLLNTLYRGLHFAHQYWFMWLGEWWPIEYLNRQTLTYKDNLWKTVISPLSKEYALYNIFEISLTLWLMVALTSHFIISIMKEIKYVRKHIKWILQKPPIHLPVGVF